MTTKVEDMNISDLENAMQQYKEGKQYALESIKEAWPYAAKPASDLRDEFDDSPYGDGLRVGVFQGMRGSGHLFVDPDWVNRIIQKYRTASERLKELNALNQK